MSSAKPNQKSMFNFCFYDFIRLCLFQYPHVGREQIIEDIFLLETKLDGLPMDAGGETNLDR